MVQKQIGHTLPPQAACGDAMADMGSEESVLILIQHCRDMKQQETRLRLITLLLLLSCTALFIFTCADVRQRENSGSSGQGSTAYSKQERVCPADNPQTNFQRLRIYLESVPADSTTDGLYITWNAMHGDNYNKEKCAIVIPENGFYFVYVRVALSCNEEDGTANFKKFYVALHNWNEGYNETQVLTDAWDGVECTSDGFRSVFVGQLFDLLKGDHVSVWIQGYELIMKSSFGAYLT